MSSTGGVQQCSLDSVLPQKAKEKNLHSDLPQAHGLGKVTEMFQASLSLFLQFQVRHWGLILIMVVETCLTPSGALIVHMDTSRSSSSLLSIHRVR